jgi:hypothetical protein
MPRKGWRVWNFMASGEVCRYATGRERARPVAYFV